MNSDKDSHKLIEQGFRCLDNSLTVNTSNANLRNRRRSRADSIKGTLKQIGKIKKRDDPPTYIWVRRNWRDPNPILNIAVSSGKGKGYE